MAPTGWYYMRDGKMTGPFTSTQLVALAKSGQLKPTDLVWKAGMEQWKLANTVKDLFSSEPAHGISDAELDQLVRMDLPDLVQHFAGIRPDKGGEEFPGQGTTGARGPSSHTAGPGTGGTDATQRLLDAAKRFIERAYDLSISAAELMPELEEVRRLSRKRQKRLKETLRQIEQDRNADLQRLNELEEVIRLKKLAQAARRDNRDIDADRFEAQAQQIQARMGKVSNEEKAARLADLQQRLEHAQQEHGAIAEALVLVEQAWTDTVKQRQEIAAMARRARPEPTSPSSSSAKVTFETWYANAFSGITSQPQPISFFLQAMLWTVGMGFMWIPFYYLIGSSLSCPACGGLWARTAEGERLLKRQQGHGQVERQDYRYDRNGHYQGRTSRVEQVVINHDLVQVHYHCKKCGHRWAEIEERSYEA